MTKSNIRKVYGPIWKAKGIEISDDAVALVSKLSVESISGFEGADFIGFTPIIQEALDAFAAAPHPEEKEDGGAQKESR